jgi:hypothetical protein
LQKRIRPEDPDLYLNPDLLELCELAAPGLQREPATGPVHSAVFTGTAGNKFVSVIKNHSSRQSLPGQLKTILF